MFKLNLKIAFRNLIKNGIYTLINIGGLAIGLVAFVMVLLYINYEDSYDQWSPKLGSVYQLREWSEFFSADNKPIWENRIDSRVATLLAKNTPQIVHLTKVGQSNLGKYAIKIEQFKALLMDGIYDTDSMFFKVMPYTFLHGDQKTALDAPNSIILKQSMALKLFGNSDVLGKSITMIRNKYDKGTLHTITGIIEDPKTPESLAFNAVFHSGTLEKDPDQRTFQRPCYIYIKLAGQADTGMVNHSITRSYKTHQAELFAVKTTKQALKVVPLKEVHLQPPGSEPWNKRLRPIVALSVFLLLVSVINFVNLATAQSVQRAKEVGIKKVLGSYKRQLVRQFLFEAAIQSLVALIASIVLVELLLPILGEQFGTNLSFWHSSQLGSIFLQLFVAFLIVTLLAGAYPAWVLANYNPVYVLKGNFEHGFKGLALRNGLVILQFAIAVTSVIVIGVMESQSRYLANMDLGYDRKYLININSYLDPNLMERIERIPGVEDVATTTQMMGNSVNYFVKVIYRGNEHKMNHVFLTPEALPALGVRLISGRLFSKEYGADSVNTIILNESAAKLLGKNLVGQQIDVEIGGPRYSFQVVGIIKDYHNEGFDKTVLPTVYKANPTGSIMFADNLIVRFNTPNYLPVISAIEHEWNKMFPNWRMSYTSGEDSFQNQLLSSKRLMNMILLFSIVCVILSLLGLFAMSAFVSRRRTREIAIRKIMGASNLQIIGMLNRSFLNLVLLANLVSYPLAYIAINKWLQSFAYRIDMPAMPFLMATLISVLIAVITVTLQSRRAALINPVDALKYE